MVNSISACGPELGIQDAREPALITRQGCTLPKARLEKGVWMRIGFGSLVVAVAGGAAAAILGAPNAVAQCSDEGPTGTDTVCQSPGNVQINDSMPVYDEGFMSGMYGGPYAVPFAEGGI